MATWKGTPGAGWALVSYAALLLRLNAPTRLAMLAKRLIKSTIVLQLLEYESLGNDKEVLKPC
jgi:hypothetical protein